MIFSSVTVITSFAGQFNSLNLSSTQSTNKIAFTSTNQSITIQSNQDFTTLQSIFKWPGDGTAKSPIIIQNFNFTQLNLHSSNDVISIQNTDLYFILRENIITTNSTFNQLSQHSIYLKNVANGRILDNNITSQDFKGFGIYINNSKNIQLTNNIVNDFFYGALISNSNITVSNNLFENCYVGTSFSDIGLTDTTGNPVYWVARFQENFYFHSNTGLEVIGTEFYFIKYNIVIEGNTFSTNSIGLTISAYSVNLRDNYFSQNTNIALKLTRSLNSNVTNNKFDHNHYGIKIIEPSYIDSYKLVNCGINPHIPECGEPLVNNTIYLHFSNITISNNIISNQSYYGIYIANRCDFNKIIGNNLLNNTIQAYQLSTNFWSNNTLGNFWSNYNGTDTNNDGFGDSPYVIQQNGEDLKPLMKKQQITINNSDLGQIKYVSPDLADSIIHYSIFMIPIIAVSVSVITAAVIYKYKKYVAQLKPNQKKISFSRYFKRNLKLKPKEKPGTLHADKALEMLEEIMDETNKT